MGLYTITTRAEGTVLTGFGATTEDIFNGDHENHVTHTAAEFFNSWEEDVAQMQQTTAPTTNAAGTALSLPTVLKDEHERLRYQIALIKQKISGAATPPFWYTPTSAFTDGVQLSPTAARLELATAQSIPDNTFTAVAYDTLLYAYPDAATVVSLATLRAPVDGVYICGASFALESIGAGLFQLMLRTITPTSVTRDIAANAIYGTTATARAITVETVKRLTAGTRMFTLVLQQSGSAQPAYIALARPAMWMSLVGRG